MQYCFTTFTFISPKKRIHFSGQRRQPVAIKCTGTKNAKHVCTLQVKRGSKIQSISYFIGGFVGLRTAHLLYIFTSVWVLHTPNAGQKMLFQWFFDQTRCPVHCLLVKIILFSIAASFSIFFCHKWKKKKAEKIFCFKNRVLVDIYQIFFLNFSILYQIFCFFHKNFEKAYFDQCLVCTAPKFWSKYTHPLQS